MKTPELSLLKIYQLINTVSLKADNDYFFRRRVLSSKIIILIIFKLILSKNKQGYLSVINEFWDECKIKKIPLKSKKSISASSFYEARTKLKSDVFINLNQEIINNISSESYSNENTWYGYRPFAVDGSNLNLPKQLIGNGYKLPRPDAHYPQGKLSCLYNLKMELPWNFKFSSDKNERALAESHFSHLRKTDVVVYDRGYFSYGFIKKHFDLNLNFVMRLSSQFVFKEINDFIKSDKTDEVISIYPSTKRKRKILIKHPNLQITQIKIRLIKYNISNKIYIIGTNIFDTKITINNFSELYHSRWGIEELYKISKTHIDIEDFHSKNEEGVLQEIYAHFCLISMAKILVNKVDKKERKTVENNVELKKKLQSKILLL